MEESDQDYSHEMEGEMMEGEYEEDMEGEMMEGEYEGEHPEMSGLHDGDMMDEEGEEDENIDFENDPNFSHLPRLDRNRASRRDIL